MKTKFFVLIYTLIFGSLISVGQVRIKMQKEGGVYKIPCVVNGLKLKFIFDTGATKVCISLSEANLMLENGYLDKKDIIGKGKSQIADGSIINNTRINLREIRINSLVLENVEAIVVNNLKAPLLLGQSAIEKLGKIQIDGDELIVLNIKGKDYTEAQIDEMFTQAKDCFNNDMFSAAADMYQKLYDMKQLSASGILSLARSYYHSNNYSKALNYYLEIQSKTTSIGLNEEDVIYYNYSILSDIASCYYYLEDYSQAELYIQKSELFSKSNFHHYCTYFMLVNVYAKTKNCYLARKNIYLAIKYNALDEGYSNEDVFSSNAKNSGIARNLGSFGLSLINCGYESEGKGMICLSAQYGYENAIEYCKAFDLNYKNYSWQGGNTQ